MKVEPLKYHGPGWELTEGQLSVMLWAPNEKRDHWSVCWEIGHPSETETDDEGNPSWEITDGNFHDTPTLTDALGYIERDLGPGGKPIAAELLQVASR